MQEDKKDILWIVIRYVVLILLALGNLWIFYFLLTPLTVYASAYILKIFYPVQIYFNNIVIGSYAFEIIEACVAGSAYYLLLILNLTTRNVNKRLKAVLFSFSLLFILNVLRIVILAVLSIQKFAFFDITHKIFWYVISTLYVVFIWLAVIKIFKIKDIPFYSDFKFLMGLRKKVN